MEANKKYRTIFICQPAYNFSSLASVCDGMTFLVTGSEVSLEQTLKACRSNLTGFDPEKDALLMVGKVNISFIVGVVLRELVPADKTITMGIYIKPKDRESYYRWESVTL